VTWFHLWLLWRLDFPLIGREAASRAHQMSAELTGGSAGTSDVVVVATSACPLLSRLSFPSCYNNEYIFLSSPTPSHFMLSFSRDKHTLFPPSRCCSSLPFSFCCWSPFLLRVFRSFFFVVHDYFFVLRVCDFVRVRISFLCLSFILFSWHSLSFVS